MTAPNDMIAQVYNSIANHNTRLLRNVMGDHGPMSHAALEVETGIGRSTIQRWEQRWGKKTAGRTFLTTGTKDKYAAYLKRQNRKIRARLVALTAADLRRLKKLI